MKKILTIIAVIMLSFVCGFSQSLDRQVIASGGGQYSGSSYIVTSTIGEPVIGTASQGAYTVSQGFEQGYFTAPSELENITVNYRIYPNPVQDFLYIEFTAEKSPELNMSIYDIKGSCMLAVPINFAGNKAKIQQDVSAFETGTYIIKIYDTQNKVLQTLKFIKK